MSRIFDRGALTGAFVGVGVAVTMAMSFLLIIPIEPAYLLLSVPAGIVIGYYANAKSRRVRGQWRRLLPNAALAGLVTGLTLAALLLGTKALFFYADNGYRDASAGGPITCDPGAACVYQRYLLVDDGSRVAGLEAAGVTDAASFTAFYWSQQFAVAGLIVAVTTAGGLGGSLLYWVFRPKPVAPTSGTRETSTAA